METEEIQIKVGMRTENIKRGVSDAVESMRHGAHEMGLHIEGVGKTGKKMLHDLEHISPLLAEGVRAFFNPLVAGMMAVHLLFKDWESFNESIVKAAEKEARIYARREEAAAKMRDQSSKANEAFKEWEEKMDSGKAGSEGEEKLRKRLEVAREEAGGNNAAFLRRKEQIEQEAAADAAKEEAAKRAEARTEKALGDDKKRGEAILELKAQIQDLLKEEEEAKKHAVEGSTLNKVGRWLTRGNPFAFVKAGDPASEVVKDAKREQRLLLEEKLNGLESAESAEKKSLQRTQKEAEAAQAAKLKLEKDVSETKTKARDEEEKEAEKAAKAMEAALEKERVHHFEQLKFDRDLADSRRKRKEQENADFLPTLQAITGAAAWNPAALMADRLQRQQDDFRIKAGMSYASQFAQQAQDLEMLEADAKRALFVEGPESSRFKEDKKRIDSLKKGLAEAGLQRPDDKLESIDKHIADLLDKASKDGLVVQPVNGA